MTILSNSKNKKNLIESLEFSLKVKNNNLQEIEEENYFEK